VLTNVPLPDVPLSVAGHRLAEVYPVVPLAPGQTMGLAVTTYRRNLHIGLHADPEAIPDLDHLGEAITAALGKLVTAATTP
jgi:diacylglycerol O-acyltransferase